MVTMEMASEVGERGRNNGILRLFNLLQWFDDFPIKSVNKNLLFKITYHRNCLTKNKMSNYFRNPLLFKKSE